jgi:L-alanine-DL-glutamate epimerase-like enolase superfamily enzyme
MRITQLESELVRLPLTRPIRADAEDRRGRVDHVYLLIVHLDTEVGHRGVGYAYSLEGGGRAMKSLADDDLAPLLVGEDPLDHERLAGKVYWRLQGIGRRGLVAQVYSAIDLALWDLKGKAAGLPLYKLLGGARESAPVYGSDTGWLWMSPEEIVEASQPYLQQGLMGIKVKVGHSDPDLDAERVTHVREALGEDVWLAVDANQRYDFSTALSMGLFFEEEIGAEWFEEPLCCEDAAGHARLAEKLEIPIALGESLYSTQEFSHYLEARAVDVIQPDVTRIGGLTSFLRVAALAEQAHRWLSPHLMPEIAVHLACGLPHVRMVEYLPIFYPAFVEPPAIANGQLIPPKRPGLGLEIRDDVVEKYRIDA